MRSIARPADESGSIGWHPYLLGRAILALLFVIPNLFPSPAADPLPELGLIRRTNSIAWTDPNQPRPGFWVASYGIYAGDQFEVVNVGTNALAKLGEVRTNLWAGTEIHLTGRYGLAVTCIGMFVNTNVSGATLTLVTNRIESDFSAIYLTDFVEGIPVPPGNFQLFTVMQVMATNSLPALAPVAGAPIPAAMKPSLGGPEYELSGR